jgi:hypothetical protein
MASGFKSRKRGSPRRPSRPLADLHLASPASFVPTAARGTCPPNVGTSSTTFDPNALGVRLLTWPPQRRGLFFPTLMSVNVGVVLHSSSLCCLLSFLPRCLLPWTFAIPPCCCVLNGPFTGGGGLDLVFVALDVCDSTLLLCPEWAVHRWWRPGPCVLLGGICSTLWSR